MHAAHLQAMDRTQPFSGRAVLGRQQSTSQPALFAQALQQAKSGPRASVADSLPDTAQLLNGKAIAPNSKAAKTPKGNLAGMSGQQPEIEVDAEPAALQGGSGRAVGNVTNPPTPSVFAPQDVISIAKPLPKAGTGPVLSNTGKPKAQKASENPVASQSPGTAIPEADALSPLAAPIQIAVSASPAPDLGNPKTSSTLNGVISKPAASAKASQSGAVLDKTAEPKVAVEDHEHAASSPGKQDGPSETDLAQGPTPSLQALATIHLSTSPLASHQLDSQANPLLGPDSAHRIINPGQVVSHGLPSESRAGMQLRNLPGSLDSFAGPTGSAPQILAAGRGQLEVGVLDSSHGWLKIRAELGAGGAVNASLTGDPSAHESLRATVPGMTGFLAAEAVSVSSIAVHRAVENEARPTLIDKADPHDSGNPTSRHERGQDRGNPGRPDEESAYPTTAVSSGARLAGYVGIAGLAGFFTTTGFSISGSGSWLSVMA